jgi:hypothetical protein
MFPMNQQNTMFYIYGLTKHMMFSTRVLSKTTMYLRMFGLQLVLRNLRKAFDYKYHQSDLHFETHR